MQTTGVDDTEIPQWISDEVKQTWSAMQGAGQLHAYHILERMVRRIGYGDLRDPSLAIDDEQNRNR